MPPERRQPQKNKRLPFNPPRPRTSSTGAARPTVSRSNANAKGRADIDSTSASNAPSRKSTTSRRQRSPESVEASSASASDGESASGSASSHDRENSLSLEEPEYVLAEITTGSKEEDDVMSSEPVIPPKLLTRLLHQHFQSEKTKIAKNANDVVAKYVDVFVREALARAAFERSGSDGGVGSGGKRTIGDGFLEVRFSPLSVGHCEDTVLTIFVSWTG